MGWVVGGGKIYSRGWTANETQSKKEINVEPEKKLKKFRIPYKYAMTETVYRTCYYEGTEEIDAETLEEAIKKVKEEQNLDGEQYDSSDDDYGDCNYIDDSFEVDEEDAEKFAEEDGLLMTPEEANLRLDID